MYCPPLKTCTSKFKYGLKIVLFRARPVVRYPTTLYLDLVADVLLDLLLEDLVLLDFILEDLVLAKIASIQGLLFQCDSVDHSVALSYPFLWELRR